MSLFKNRTNVVLSYRPNPSIKMGGTDRCGILFYAESKTTGIGRELVAPAPFYFSTRPFQYKLAPTQFFAKNQYITFTV
jgi:hypothetical protein